MENRSETKRSNLLIKTTPMQRMPAAMTSAINTTAANASSAKHVTFDAILFESNHVKFIICRGLNQTGQLATNSAKIKPV